MVRHTTKSLLVAVAVGAALLPAVAQGHDKGRNGDKKQALPETIALPTGWQPEGIAAGPRHTVFSGSIGQGAIYVADVRTGQGKVLVPPHAGRNHTGLKYDHRTGWIFASGGASGGLYVYNASTGADVAAFDVDGGFVNDVVLAGGVAYFTDSTKPVIYALPYSKQGVGQPRTIALKDFPMGDGNNANGIAAVNGGRTLIVDKSNTGDLYTIDTASGQAHKIDLGTATLPNADGILLAGRVLYVVQNRSNQVGVVKLARDLSSGSVIGALTDPDFAVPTTLAVQDHRLYAVNAKFGTAPEGTPYEIVKVDQPKVRQAHPQSQRDDRGRRGRGRGRH